MASNEDLSEKIISQVIDEYVEEKSEVEDYHEILLNTREQGQMIECLIKNQIEVKDDMINKLHAELENYRQDAAERFVNQLMKSVIKVRKDMNRLVASEKWSTMSADELRREYLYCLEDISDLLEQQNVDSYSSLPGDAFDAKIHHAKVEVTCDATLDKIVKESVSEGYKKGNKILIPERVIVYQFK